MPHRTVSVQLLNELPPTDASVFALVMNAAAKSTAKLLTLHAGQTLHANFDEVQSSICS